MAVYSLIPQEVPNVHTAHRTIATPLPVPQSLPIFEKLRESEPVSMLGMPPVIWDKAENFTIYDKWGNRWIDWSSCVLVANSGHGRESLKQALKAQIDQGLLASYVFVHEKRAELTKALQSLSPDPKSYKVFLLSTGSEAVENAIKLAKTYSLKKHGIHKKYIISFNNAFHGRTLGSQLAGGMEKLKNWISDRSGDFIQVPFPDGYKNEDISFDLFLKSLRESGVDPKDISSVLTESYQGVGPDFIPVDYAQKLEKYCKQHDILQIYDEVQAGFGRTGKMFCFNHYGISPELIVCGKGISSSLPLSAVIGRNDVMDLYGPGSMTSTHSASPLCVVAALENLQIIENENLVSRSAELGEILNDGLNSIQQKHPMVLGKVQCKGLVAGIQVVKPGTKEPDSETALKINVVCFHKGLLMFAPVGIAGECIKISPPLTISKEALLEGLEVMEEAVEQVLSPAPKNQTENLQPHK